MGYLPGMDWVQAITEALSNADTSLCFVDPRFGIEGEDAFVWPGERPGEGWRGHGYLRIQRWALWKGRLRRIRLAKHRWLEVATGRTVHSRPPDEVPMGRYCALVMALQLLLWLTGAAGVQCCEPPFEDLHGRIDPRTLQRWLSRAQERSMESQQAVRRALIERDEPRPVERLFPGGLPPPAPMLRRRWKDPDAVGRLWRGLTILVVGAARGGFATSILLAEARGRCAPDENPWLIG